MRQSGLCRDTPEAVPEERERERERERESACKVLLFVVELGVLQIGALADWQQDHHTEKWRQVIYPTACALTFQNSMTMMKKFPKCPGYPDGIELHSHFITNMLWGSWLSPIATIHQNAQHSCRYTD